ncbi:hypothetical protein [Anaerobacillus sp. 1_MG-2023]|uniref:hypothetical protein n=1 Tax=Bacillales TaxID=1385 RepID=UPI0026E40FE1|nr:hypothetical protein [Anaerobacillus sp. 1_MG-2023]MDO6657786.1 hypothetical protein [Anaerobacillus sp. 1_MG-2023]
MKQPITLIILLSFLITGCQISNEIKTTDPEKVDPKELPKVRAFKDEFTRGFLQSIKETREGYYLFRSNTNHYTMDFPSGGVIGEMGYSIQKGSESFLVGVEGKNTDSEISIKYLEFMKKELRESRIETLIKNSKSPLNFETRELDDRTISTAYFETDKGYYGYVALVQNTKRYGAVEVTYTSECKVDLSNCEEVIKSKKNSFTNWIESIHFINQETHETSN